jgi:NTP pyrophosphatase (non-canonical NTP hydrolase)
MTSRESAAGADRTSLDIEHLKRRLREFAQARSWERLHTAKNLTTAVAAEAGELAAVLQWATADQDIEPFIAQLEDEVADVLIYLVRLCDVLNIEPLQAAYAKIKRNEQRFPAQMPASRTAHTDGPPSC